MNETKACLASQRKEVLRLRKVGLTYKEIGSRLGISRQRVGQIIKPRATKKKRAGKLPALLLTVSGAAELLSVHINTVRRWCNMGILEAYRVGPRGDRRFKRGDVENLLKKK